MLYLLRGYALIGAIFAITAPIIYACWNKSVIPNIVLNPFYYVSLALSILFLWEQLRPYIQRRHLRINAFGMVICMIMFRWTEEEISVNLLCTVCNLCAYFNEFFACLNMEEEEY